MSLQAAELIIFFATVVIAAISAVAGALVILPPSRMLDLPWWERARRTYPARLAPSITIFVLTQVLMPVQALYFGTIGIPALPIYWVIAGTLAAILAASAVAIFMAWLASPRRWPLWKWFAGFVSAVHIRFPNTIIYAALIPALYLLPHNLSAVFFVLCIGAVAMAVAAWGGSMWIARILGLARPALPRAEPAADWAAERVGVRASAVFELIWPAVRVDSFVFSRYLIFTDAAATLLTDDELFALAVREMTSFQHPRLFGTLRVLDTVLIYFILTCTAIGATIGGHALLIGTLIGFSGAMLMRPFYRRAQLKADALAATAAIDATSALRALERQFELNLQPMVAITNRSKDAHLYDRMVAAGIPPSYPRPAKPSKGMVILSVVVALLTCVLLSAVFLIAVGSAIGI